MKLTGYAKIFLTASVILIASILIVLGSDITLKEMWSNYFSQPDPWVGIFTSIGAIFTVCVFIATVYATRKAGESAKIAGEALELSRQSSRKDDFIKQFTLLIDQHEKSHEIMMKHLDNYTINEHSEISWSMTIKEASEVLYSNYKFSAYMRMLFRVLKHCDENFYMQGDYDEVIREKKKYTSIVRSLIRNDVLYFVALNSMNDRKQFKEYRNKLKKFDFFEHLITNNIGNYISFSIEQLYKQNKYSISGEYNDIYFFINVIVKYKLVEAINDYIKYKEFYFNENMSRLKEVYDILHSFNYTLAFEYDREQYEEYKKDIESLIDYKRIFSECWIEIIHNNIEFSLDIINRDFFLYAWDYDLFTDFNPRKIEGKKLSLSYLSSLIVENGMSFDVFNKYITEQFNEDEDTALFLDSSKENENKKFRDMFLEAMSIYKECNDFIKQEAIKYISNEKDIVFKKIENEVINKMNETFLIKNCGEKFILNEDNKIVFENKNS